MATKIKKRKPSKFPDKSAWAKGQTYGIRKACEAMEKTEDDIRTECFRESMLILLYELKAEYHYDDDFLTELTHRMYDQAKRMHEGFLTLEMIQAELHNVYGVKF